MKRLPFLISLFLLVGVLLFVSTSLKRAINTSEVASINPTVTTTATPPTPGMGCTQADIQNLVNNVPEDKIREYEQELVQDNSKSKPNELISRWIGSPGNQKKLIG